MTGPFDLRYHRQQLLPMIGPEGQSALQRSRVLIIGCGALGTASAELLCRAGVGHMRIVDRDIVEPSNLQRQLLFDQSDALAQTPKPIAAARRLSQINSQITLEPICADACPDNIATLATWPDGSLATVILDGTDNVQTRYLINDFAVKMNIPWVYGACVGTEGRMMPIHPSAGPCLRCIFPTPPAASDLPACDTAGVLGPAATAIAALQAAAAIRIITQIKAQPIKGTSLISSPDAEKPAQQPVASPDISSASELKGTVPFSSAEKSDVPFSVTLLAMDLWTSRVQSITVDRDPACPCCGQKQFPYLTEMRRPTVNLCGRSAVQVWPAHQSLDLKAIATRLAGAGEISASAYFLRFTPAGTEGLQLTIFPDGRALIAGTTDTGRALALYSRYVGQ